MIGAYGRIDWMVQQKIWRIVGYIQGRGKAIREVEVGRATEREIALAILRDWYKENQYLVRYA